MAVRDPGAVRTVKARWAALVFVVFTLGLQWLPGVSEHWRFSRAAYADGAWWQLLTSQWVHFGGLHAAVNAVAMVVLLLAFHGLVSGRLQVLALLGGYAGVAALIALDPACTSYAGASGALHGLLAGGALAMLGKGTQSSSARAKSRAVGWLLLAGLAAKLLVQHLGADPVTPGWLGFTTYHAAHDAGAVGGVVAVLLARAANG